MKASVRVVVVALIIASVGNICAAFFCLNRIHPDQHVIATAELEQGLSTRLESISTPEEMQKASADLARIVAATDRTIHSLAALTNELLGFLLLVGVINLVLILLGIWMSASGRKSSSQT